MNNLSFINSPHAQGSVSVFCDENSNANHGKMLQIGCSWKMAFVFQFLCHENWIQCFPPTHRHHLQKSVVHQTLGDLAAVVEETNGVLDHTDMKWRPATKSLCKTAPKYRSILSTATVSTLQDSSQCHHRLSLISPLWSWKTDNCQSARQRGLEMILSGGKILFPFWDLSCTYGCVISCY